MYNTCLFLLLLIQPSIQKCEEYSAYNQRVQNFEDLINQGRNDATNYRPPTNAYEFKPSTNTPKDCGTFDFIIVGGGTSGSVMANRLSEIHDWNILVLEAGTTPDTFTDIPAMWTYASISNFSWDFRSISNSKSCLGLTDNRCMVPRGKVLGGSSVLNNLMYSRGNRLDYDRWAESGLKGWSFQDVLPYFIKSEHCQVDGDPGYHGKGGYWNVKYRYEEFPVLEALIDATRNSYNYTSNDFNGKCPLGIFHGQFNTIRGRRQSTYKAFLADYLDRPNLKILQSAYVTKILFDRTNKEARGVEFSHKSQLCHVSASKEVILAAGAVGSPQILMLSGIGPRDELKGLGIHTIKRLPVGKTLFDHPQARIAYIRTNHTTHALSLREQVEEFLDSRGPLTTPQVAAVGFFQSSGNKVPNYPDIELAILPVISLETISMVTNNFTEETYQTLAQTLDFESDFNINIIFLDSKSIGSVRLASNNPYDYPIIDLNLLDDPRDIDILYEGLNIVENLLETPEMKRLNAKLLTPEFPQCRNYKLGSRDYWNCFIRLLIRTTNHPITTCSMGVNPETSVVDHQLKVHGMKKLRVADSSVIPHLPAGHTAAPTVMIAEKISDEIKKEYHKHVAEIHNVFGENS